jgi:hypothetical protein
MRVDRLIAARCHIESAAKLDSSKGIRRQSLAPAPRDGWIESLEPGIEDAIAEPTLFGGWIDICCEVDHLGLKRQAKEFA